VHSKLNGDGWLDTPQKIKRLTDTVRENMGGGSSNTTTSNTNASVFMKDDMADTVGADEDEEEGNASLIVSLLTLVLSIPALIGA